MNIALIGATGFVGKAILTQLLQREHQVTALVRNPAQLLSQAGLHVVQNDVTDMSQFAPLIEGHDVVISAFNAGWHNSNLYHDFLRGSQAIQAGVKKAGVGRLIVIGGAGSLYIDGKQLVDSPDFPAEWKAGASAARDYLTELQEETELDWVLVSPAIEMHPGTSGVSLGRYRKGGDHPVFDQRDRSVISVEDLALAIVDEVEQPTYHRQRFTVAY